MDNINNINIDMEILIKKIKSGEIITDEIIDAYINYDSLDEDSKKKVDEYNKKLDINNNTLIFSYGIEMQNAVVDILCTKLSKINSISFIKLKDMYMYLEKEISRFILASNIKEKKGFFGLSSSIKEQYDSALTEFNIVSENIEFKNFEIKNIYADLTNSYEFCYKLCESLINIIRDISIHIFVGKNKSKYIRDVYLPSVILKAHNTDNELDAQSSSVLNAMLNRFEKRLEDLKDIRNICIKLVPIIFNISNIDKNCSRGSLFINIDEWLKNSNTALALDIEQGEKKVIDVALLNKSNCEFQSALEELLNEYNNMLDLRNINLNNLKSQSDLLNASLLEIQKVN